MPKRRCTPSKYASVTGKGNVLYGFRCSRCRITGVTFDSERERDEAMTKHLKEKRWKK